MITACFGRADSGDDTDVVVETDDTDPPPAVGSFAAVQLLFDRSCATAGCHAAPGQQGASPTATSTGLDLSAGAAYAQLVDVPSHEVPEMVRVKPGSVDDSYLWHKVTGTFADSGIGGTDDVMPTFPGLIGDDLEVVRAWIEGGAPSE